MDIKIFKSLIIKLSSIVNDNDMRNFKLINDTVSDKSLNLSFGYVYQRFCFHPLGEVINHHNDRLSLTESWGKGLSISIFH